LALVRRGTLSGSETARTDRRCPSDPPEVAESLAHYAELAGEVRNGLSALVALGRKLQVDAARAKKSKRRKG